MIEIEKKKKRRIKITIKTKLNDLKFQNDYRPIFIKHLLATEGNLDILFVNKKQIHVTAKQMCTKCCACKKTKTTDVIYCAKYHSMSHTQKRTL